MSDDDKKKTGDEPTPGEGSQGTAVVTTDAPAGDADDERPEAAEAKAQAESEFVSAPARRADWSARILALIAVLVAAGVGASTVLSRIEGGSAARLAALDERLTTLADENHALGERVRAAEDTAPVDLGPLERRISEVETALGGLKQVQDRLNAVDARVAALEGRGADGAALSELQARVDALAAAVAGQEGGGAGLATEGALADVRASLDRLEGELEGAVTQLETADRALRDQLGIETERLGARLDDVAATAAETNRAVADRQAERAALVLAVGRLRDAARAGRPFPGAWEAVTRLGVDASAHPAIAEAAAKGVPSVEELAARFPGVANDTLTADLTGEDDSWVGGAMRRLGSLVSVRRTGEIEGDSIEARVARAEQRVASGDLEAALAELEGLQGEAAQAVADWRGAAERRLALDKAVTALQRTVFERMAQDG